jgi:hypothetical protein
MQRVTVIITALAILALSLFPAAVSAERSEPVIIDHNCTDLSAIPDGAIQNAKDLCKWHYVRLSHGRQIMVGLDRLEDLDVFYKSTWPTYGGSLPDDPDALCIYTLAGGPWDYWDGSGSDNTRSILENNPAISVSSFCWCTDLNSASESYVQSYLDSMLVLESQYPEVTFVYFTGTAEYDGGYGYNRALRNRQIRDFCVANNKVLFDFEDLDSWWYDPDAGQWEQATYQYQGETVPVEHPNLAGNDAEHTSYESCEQKGKATWWMMAVLAGWSPPSSTTSGPDTGPAPADRYRIDMKCYPNPCNPVTNIEFVLQKAAGARLCVYDASGRKVRTLVNRFLNEGKHSLIWNGENDLGRPVSSGVYLYRLRAGKESVAKKILLLR